MAYYLWLVVLMLLQFDTMMVLSQEEHKSIETEPQRKSSRARRAVTYIQDKEEEEEDSGDKNKRKPEMDSSGFYGDTFSNGFGDFYTMKKSNPNRLRYFNNRQRNEKRRPEMDASGFYGDTFNGGFGDFYTMKKRRPEMDASGFHGDTFNGGFGDFYTMKKRRPEMDASGFYGDTFNSGFGDFYTMKRGQMANLKTWRDALEKKLKQIKTSKRRPEMDASGFYGDTFDGGFGDFYTMKRN